MKISLELRGAVATGLDQARRGELIPGDQVFEGLKPESRRRRERTWVAKPPRSIGMDF